MKPTSHRRALAVTALAATLALPLAAAAQEGETTPSCHEAPASDQAHQGHQRHTEAAKPAAAAPKSPEDRLRIPDMALLNHDGEPIHFYSDLVKDKVVAMNFIFTTCTTVCPPMGANFSRLQDTLGDRLGRDVQLISVSIDPTTDTPPRLKAWGEKFDATEAWTFVTGLKTDVDQVLRQLEALSPDVKDHGPVVLLVNDRTGTWRRVHGLTPPNKLAVMLDELLEEEPSKVAEVTR